MAYNLGVRVLRFPTPQKPFKRSPLLLCVFTRADQANAKRAIVVAPDVGAVPVVWAAILYSPVPADYGMIPNPRKRSFDVPAVNIGGPVIAAIGGF